MYLSFLLSEYFHFTETERQKSGRTSWWGWGEFHCWRTSGFTSVWRHCGETSPLWPVWQELPFPIPFKETSADSHWRKASPLWPVWGEFPSKRQFKETSADSLFQSVHLNCLDLLAVKRWHVICKSCHESILTLIHPQLQLSNVIVALLPLSMLLQQRCNSNTNTSTNLLKSKTGLGLVFCSHEHANAAANVQPKLKTYLPCCFSVGWGPTATSPNIIWSWICSMSPCLVFVCEYRQIHTYIIHSDLTQLRIIWVSLYTHWLNTFFCTQ